MNWRIKSHSMALLSRIPAGRQMFHAAQRMLGTNRLDFDESLNRSVEIVELAREAGQRIEGGTILEIGTGWRPFLPILLSLLGARRIVSIDVNPWLTARYARETLHAFGMHLDRIAERLQVDRAKIRERFSAIDVRTADLQHLLEAMRIEYRYPGDARHTGLADRSIDVVCSSNVLEHISQDAIAAIHHESVRILRPGAIAVHRFNPGDHFATVDPGISAANFLQFSPSEWHWHGGSGMSYHNRLRCVQHARLMEQAGFELVVNRTRDNPRAADDIASGRLSVHSDFAQFSPQELAADYMWLVGRASRS